MYNHGNKCLNSKKKGLKKIISMAMKNASEAQMARKE